MLDLIPNSQNRSTNSQNSWVLQKAQPIQPMEHLPIPPHSCEPLPYAGTAFCCIERKFNPKVGSRGAKRSGGARQSQSDRIRPNQTNQTNQSGVIGEIFIAGFKA
jgi:hypothetical protein